MSKRKTTRVYIDAEKYPEGMRVALNNCTFNMNMRVLDETSKCATHQMKKARHMKKAGHHLDSVFNCETLPLSSPSRQFAVTGEYKSRANHRNHIALKQAKSGTYKVKRGAKPKLDVTICRSLQRAMEEFEETYLAMITELTEAAELDHYRLEEYARFIVDLAGR